MGNYAYFDGCRSPTDAPRVAEDPRDGGEASEPEIEAKYSIPLFWLAGFAPDELVTVQVPDPEQPGAVALEYVVPCTSVRQYAARARARRSGIVGLLPEALGGYYDEWIRFVERRYARCVLIRTSDLFSMSGHEEAGLRLRGALRALQVADDGGAVEDSAALDWFGGFVDRFRDRATGEAVEDCAQGWRLLLAGSAYLPNGSGTLLWPTRPTPAELAFATSLPQAAVHEPGSPAAAAADLTSLVRSGVVASTPGSRLHIALKKISGQLPTGVDAPTLGLRKTLGSAGELLNVLRDGFFGLLLALLGPVFIWAGWGPPPSWTTLAVGVGCLLPGLWLLRSAWRAQRRLRAILRA